jgi:hypothetical protein
MTTPKVSTIKRGEARFYISPDDAGVKYPGVTSILNMLPKGFLKFWAAKSVAQAAVDNAGTLVNMLLGPAGPEAAVDFLKRAPDRDTRQAADTGTAAHDLMERLARGETLGRVHPDLEPYVRHFSEFLDVMQPEFLYLEETVWSDEHQYAGSFDWLARINGELVWGDNKTTRSGIHEEVGVQLAAYRHAESIVREDGGRIPLPKADGGAVFHVRPEGWKLVPVRCDQVLFDDVFLPLREVFRYEKELKSTIIGKVVASGPADGGIVESGPKRRTPRAAPKPAPAAS